MSQPTPAETTGRLPSLDILRTVAVLLVIIRHSADKAIDPQTPGVDIARALVRGGWVGVDLFFVLSGFLVSGLLFREYGRRGQLDLKRFYVRRALKILPSFWFFLAIAVLAKLAKYHWVEPRRLLAELFFLQNYLGGLQNHTWSLAVEEHFYTIIPGILLLLSLRRRGLADPFRPIVPLCLMVGAACLGLRLLTAHLHPVFDYGTHLSPTHLRIDSLLFGVMIAYFYHQHHAAFVAFGRRGALPLLMAGVAMLLPPFLIEMDSTPFVYTYGYTLFYIGSGAILTAAVARPVGFGMIGKALAYIGAHSYSIYLWHFPVHLWFTAKLVSHAAPQWEWPLQMMADITLSLVVGIVASKLVEFPVLRLRDRFFPSRSDTTAASQNIANGSGNALEHLQ